MDIDWSNDKNKIIQESAKCQHVEELKKVEEWDRRTVDLKPVINDLEKILDKHKLSWTQRIAKVLSKKKPSGQLEDFLGTEVINSIWSS